MKHRFYFAEGDNLIQIVKTLEEKEYFQLSDAGHELTKIVIDTELRQFWLISDRHFASTVLIVKSKHKDVFHELEPNEVDKL